MSHRHLFGIIIVLLGIIFVSVGVNSFEARSVNITPQSIMVKIFDQDFNGPLVTLGIILIFIGVYSWWREKMKCHVCNKGRR